MKRIIIFVFGLSFSGAVNAQSVYNKNALVSISSATIFTVGDSLINNGELTNNGDIRVSGAWINNGTYDAGNGQITFNSNKEQIINHNDQSFEKLVINGGGVKKFLANITIESELNLQSGVLQSSNDAKIIIKEGAKITGGTDKAHVVGPVEHLGKGDWEFPVGNGKDYLPVIIKGVTDSKANAVLILHEIASEKLTSNIDFDKVSDQRYWELKIVDGSLQGSRVELPLVNEDLGDNPELWAVASAKSIADPFESLGQSAAEGNSSSGRVTSENSPQASLLSVGKLTDNRIIVVYNGVSPNGDGLNDFLKIHNIAAYPDNTVSLFNRWGDKVFEAKGYDNDKIIFKGENNVQGGKLMAGTYFYSIEPGDGSAKVTGYLELRF